MLKEAGFFSFPSITGKIRKFPPDQLYDYCERLAEEYTRLFSAVPQYSSLHRRDDRHYGELFGSKAAEIKKFLTHFGVETTPPGQIPDHIGVLLEFNAKILEEEFSAGCSGDKSRIEELESLQQIFLKRYVTPWFEEFLTQLEKLHPSDFYQSVIDIARILLEEQTIPEADLPGDNEC